MQELSSQLIATIADLRKENAEISELRKENAKLKAELKHKQQTNSFRRDPSGFELIDQRVRKYTLCHQSKHNSRTCQLSRN